MPKIKKLLLVVLFSVLLEFFYFQRDYWIYRLDGNVKTSLTLTLEDAQAINWEISDSGMISNEDPILLFLIDPIYVYNLKVSYKTIPDIETCTVIYRDAQNELKSTAVTAVSGNFNVLMRENLGTELRIDLGEAAGTRLDEITVVINNVPFTPSLSRIIAVILIYICGVYLFKIQEMPDYQKYFSSDNSSKSL